MPHIYPSVFPFSPARNPNDSLDDSKLGENKINKNCPAKDVTQGDKYFFYDHVGWKKWWWYQVRPIFQMTFDQSHYKIKQRSYLFIYLFIYDKGVIIIFMLQLNDIK